MSKRMNEEDNKTVLGKESVTASEKHDSQMTSNPNQKLVIDPQKSPNPTGNLVGDTVLTKGNDEDEKLTLMNNLHKIKINERKHNQRRQRRSDVSFDSESLKNISPLRRQVRKFIRSKPILYLIVFLVIVYTILIFVDIALNQLVSEEDLASIDDKLRYVELAILCTFQIEILLNAYGTGIKQYFRDNWLLLDEIIIILSLALVIIDLTISFGSQLSSIASIIRAIFRFLRIFLLLRKLHNFKKIKVSSTIKTPSEKVVEILAEFKDYFDNNELISDIEWTIKMIASNKLYEPVLNEGGDKGDLVAAWSNQNQNKQQNANTGGTANFVPENKSIFANKKANLKQVQSMPSTAITRFIPPQVMTHFEKIDEISMDCFELQKVAKGQEVSQILVHLFDKYNLLNDLKIDVTKFIALAIQIQNGYRDNLYHDRLHSFDVTQSVHFFLSKCKFSEIAKITQLERAAMYFSASIHDYDHPGVNNAFLINTQNILALKFNDQSVLENHHVSSAFEMILSNESLNIFANFSNDDFKAFREISINMVLSTDMTKHFTDISKLKQRIQAQDFDIQGKDKKTIMESILHASDISNPIRPWKMCFSWTERVMQEFWAQGDQERSLGIPITYLCDRYETNTSKSQHGFIDFVVRPLFEILQNVLPEITPYMANFDLNKEKWTELQPKYEQELKTLKEDKEKANQNGA